MRPVIAGWHGTLCSLAAALPLLLGGCGDAGPDSVPNIIATDTFVDTYVALRIAALSRPTGELTEQQRDSILSANNVRSEKMIEFAEIHGRDATFMQAVWDSVEVRFSARRDALSRLPETN